MSLFRAIRKKLKSSAEVFALVGDRIHPVRLPQSTAYPAISFWALGQTPTHSLDGHSGVVDTTIQIDLWGESRLQLDELALAVFRALDSWRGVYEGVDIQQMFCDDAGQDVPEDSPLEPELKHVAMDFSVSYEYPE